MKVGVLGLWHLGGVTASALASLGHHEYLETVRGWELLQLGSFKRDVGHHKSKEYEDGIYCFVVGPGVSDRQAATSVFYPHANTKFRKFVEMFHFFFLRVYRSSP